MLVYKRKA
jgi:hypothetical protein